MCPPFPTVNHLFTHIYGAQICGKHWRSYWNAQVESPGASPGPVCPEISIPSPSLCGVVGRERKKVVMSPSGCISQAPGLAGGHWLEPSGQEKRRNMGAVSPLSLPWATPLVVAASLPWLQLPEARPVIFPASASDPGPWPPVR